MSEAARAPRALPVGALALGVLGVGLLGAVAWYFNPSVPEIAAEAPPAGMPPAPVTSVPATTPAPAMAATSAAPSAPASAAVPAAGDDLAALQSRLDAFAAAYNAADVAALERVLWKNHAVERPTGEVMYRSELIGQWTREWTELANRELSFVVETLSREGEQITAVWDLSVRGDVTDEKGQVHKLEINGSQRATYAVTGQDWVLDGPIVYVGFERTIDGDPWPLGQNGR